MRIDHVIWATGDLDAAAARIQGLLGVAAEPGGRHEGLGTHNVIVPLGGGYLELLAIADPAEAAASELGRPLQERIAEVGDGLFAWAVAVETVEAVAERLGTPVTRIGRQGLSARLTGLAEALREPYLPFFISRDHGIPDPGEAGGAGGIRWIEVAGDADRLDSWLDGAELPVRIVKDGGPPGVRGVGIGERELR